MQKTHRIIIVLLFLAVTVLLSEGVGLAGNCHVCLKPIENGWRYCPYCGSRVRGFFLRKKDEGNLLIGTEGPTKKVYREPGTFDGTPAPEAKISLARGEYEAVQVVLYPVPGGEGKIIHTYSYAVTDLVGGNGRIKKMR